MERKSMGGLISALRRANGMTQKDLAEKLHVSDKAVSRWERDESVPDLALLPQISDVFSITVDELIRGERKAKETDENDSENDAARQKRLRKQTKHAVNAALSRLRVRLLIAVGMGGLGLLAAAVCNFGFSAGTTGFLSGIILWLCGGAVMLAVFGVNAWKEMDEEDYGEENVKKYRGAVARLVKGAGMGMLIFLALILPFAACLGETRFANVMLPSEEWLLYGLLCGSGLAVIGGAAMYGINSRMIRKGLLASSARHRWHGIAAGVLAVVYLATLGWAAIAASDENFSFFLRPSQSFGDFEAFQQFCEARAKEKWDQERDADLLWYRIIDGEEVPERYDDEQYLRKVYDANDTLIGTVNIYGLEGWTIQFDDQGGISHIFVYTEADYANARQRQSAAVNRIRAALVLEPMAAFSLWMLVTGGKQKNA